MAVETDVFVVGGGPAGLAVAIAARNRGFSVTVADVAQPPIDKACAEGIMPDGLAALRKLGVNIPLDAASAFQGIRFSDGESSVQARFAQGPGLGTRRTKLHEILIDNAAAAGIDMHWGARVTGSAPDGVTINGINVRCRWLVGADGQNSRVRCWSGLDSVRTPAIDALRLSPSLSRCAMVGVCGSLLDQTRTTVCHAGRSGGSLRRLSQPESENKTGRRIRRISPNKCSAEGC